MATDPNVVSKFTAGYSQCATEVTRYLNRMEGFNPEIKNRLTNHLSTCVDKLPPTQAPPSATITQGGLSFPQGILNFPQGTLPLVQGSMSLSSGQPIGMPLATGNSQSQPMELNLGQLPTATPVSAMPGTQTQHGTVLFSNTSTSQTVQQNVPVVPVQLIPAKLPSGDMVFLLANTQNPSVPVTNMMTPVSIQIPSSGSSTISSSIASMSMAAASAATAGLAVSTVVPQTTSVAVVPPQVHLPKVISPVKSESDILSPIKIPQPSTSGLQLNFPFYSGTLSDSSSPSGSEKDMGASHSMFSLDHVPPPIFHPVPLPAPEKDINDNLADCDNLNNNNHDNNNNNVPIQQQQQQQLPQYQPMFLNVNDPNALTGPMWRPW